MLTPARIRELLDPARWEEGEALVRSGKVFRTRLHDETAQYLILGPVQHTVTLRPPDLQACSCGERLCSHLAAALLRAQADGSMAGLLRRQEEMSAQALFSAAEGALPAEATVRLEPSLYLAEGGLSLGLRLGEERLYAVEHLPRFLQAVRGSERLQTSRSFTYDPGWMRFDAGQERFLAALQEACDLAACAAGSLNASRARRIALPPPAAKRLLEALGDLSFRLTVGGRSVLQTGMETAQVPGLLRLSGTPAAMKLSAAIPRDAFLAVPDGSFLFADGRLSRVPGERQALLRALFAFRTEDSASFSFGRREIPRLLSELLPWLMRIGTVTLDPQLERRLVRLPLTTRVYLDRAGKRVDARVVFQYGSHEVDPFSPDGEAPPLLLRDTPGENRVLDLLSQGGFRVRTGHAYLSGDEEVWRFLTQGAEQLSRVAELYLSREFQRLAPRVPSLRGRLRSGPGRLSLEVLDEDQPMEELLPLMRALSEGRRYFRFRDGGFLDLRGLEAWKGLAGAVREAELAGGRQENLGAFRAEYLEALSREAGLPVTLERETDPSAREEPASPVAGLHPWQLRGFRWIASLHARGMGGILADEMGLGKTVQMIAAIAAAQRDSAAPGVSLIIAPTSLMHNWLAEIERFAPSLRARLIAGDREERHQRILGLARGEGPDIAVSSYPLLRQDIALLEQLSFRYVVLDEAQYVKNTESLGAGAVRRLKAESFMALTGTPLENSVSELWTLFDLVLPGYLPALPDFLRRYAEGKNAGDLNLRIRPFMMRRLKSEVLTQLPGKLETTVYAGMTQEQRRVYDASLLRGGERIRALLADRGSPVTRVEVLAAITELRRICCHPALVLPQYTGRSGKLETLMDLLPSALDGGHRILVFSQFTGMLRLIQRRLAAQGLEALYLDGKTPAQERLQLAERFNAGQVPVFLVSLKAGGTGLNLTGADTVIHYDPWWNPAAEDQAADRAHRLGQKRTVQVIRLITRHSIEEQVAALGAGKRRLFEKLITPGEGLPARLCTREILALFEREREGA